LFPSISSIGIISFPSGFTPVIFPSASFCTSPYFDRISSKSLFPIFVSSFSSCFSSISVCILSIRVALSVLSLASLAFVNIPLSLRVRFIATLARISRTIIVITSAINVIPWEDLKAPDPTVLFWLVVVFQFAFVF